MVFATIPLNVSSYGSHAGMISYWEFNDNCGTTAIDSVDTNNGALNPSGPTKIAGKFNNALQFDGEEDYVLISDDETLETNTLTVEVWINLSVNNDYMVILEKTDYGVGGNEAKGYVLELWNTGYLRWSGGSPLYSLLTIPTEEWIHIVCIIQTSSTSIYINGDLDNTGIPSSYTPSNNEDLIIGECDEDCSTGGHRSFNGIIDEVAIYNKILSETEIADHWNDGIGKEIIPDINTVGLWHFNDGIGDSVPDSSSSNNDGTLFPGTGPTWTEGVCGNALTFDGDNDYVLVKDDSSLEPNALTVEAWINPNINNDYMVILEKTDYGVGGNEALGYVLELWNTGYLRWSGGSPLYSTSIIPTGQWTHVVCVVQDKSAKIYVNGVLNSFDTFSTFNSQNNEDLIIGKCDENCYYGGHRYFNGIIDEVAIYNKVLTRDEIETRYEAGLDCLSIDATIDIDPNTFNLKSKGKYITSYIEFPTGYDVNDIDVSTIKLNGEVNADASTKSIGNYDNDDFSDLMIKFSRSEIYNILSVGDNVEVTITGELNDGTPFEGKDYIKVINNGLEHTDETDPSSVET